MMQPDIFILKANGDGIRVKYVRSLQLPQNSDNNLIISIAPLYLEATAAIAEQFESDWLNDVQKTPLLDYLQITLSLLRFEEIIDTKMIFLNQPPIFKMQINDPSILHLAYLLRGEMECPKFLSQQFVSSIVTTLIIYCWQQL
ncbi:MAG: hypothetical protein KME59_19740 [Trichormus sp. ATA11-4-KO1]|jgi:hypothetical protein|nr:hypothetical protein [Trichormus sp. ATA11-4-KO1]